MKIFAIFLIFATLLFSNLSLADASNITSLENEDEFSSCNILKIKYEILKLRLDVIEKFGNYVPEIDQKLQYLEDKIQNLYKSVSYYRGSSDQYALLEGTSETSSSSASAEDDERRATANIKNSIEELGHDNLYITNINDEEDPEDCRANRNGRKVCSKLQLPSSCANRNDLACDNNKCRIQVNGFPSFLVSCHDEWIVIQRRLNGSVDFNRNWSSYKNGFGDLDGEFWLGLDKIHALTKALAPAELLIQMKDFNDLPSSARYESFSIGDESTDYILATPGSFSGSAGDSLYIHRDEKFTTFDKDHDKNHDANCAKVLSGGWWFFDCIPRKDNSNLNGHYFSKEASNVPRKNGIKWSTFPGANKSLKFVEMMIR